MKKSIKKEIMKKGFTLVELLAVIAILAILVVLAVPSILKMFNESKKNTFITQAQSIYKTSEQQYISDQIKESTTNKVFYKTKSDNTHTLSMSGNNKVYYYIEYTNGKITKFQVTDGSKYSITRENATQVGINEIKKENLDNPVITDTLPDRIRYTTYEVQVNVTNGTVDESTKSAVNGESVSFNLTPNERYKLEEVQVTCTNDQIGSITGNTLTVTPTSNTICTVSMTAMTAYTITNLVTNGSFENGTTGWSVVGTGTLTTVLDNETNSYCAKFTASSATTPRFSTAEANRWTITSGQMYYFKFKAKCSSLKSEAYSGMGTTTAFTGGGGNIIFQTMPTEWSITSGIRTAKSTMSSNAYVEPTIGWGSGFSGYIYYVDDVIAINLTVAFGAGNEPSKEWCDENINYFDGTTTIYK